MIGCVRAGVEVCVAEDDAERGVAVAPRASTPLQRPMRPVDVAFFTAEHDDHHLARMHELVRRAGEVGAKGR